MNNDDIAILFLVVSFIVGSIIFIYTISNVG